MPYMGIDVNSFWGGAWIRFGGPVPPWPQRRTASRAATKLSHIKALAHFSRGELDAGSYRGKSLEEEFIVRQGRRAKPWSKQY